MASQGNDCWYFYNATCYKGARCIFRHSEPAIGSDMVCEDWINDLCFIDDCPYRHMELQVQPQQMQGPVLCFYDMQPGGCRRPHCQYIHAKQVIQTVPTQPIPMAGFSSLVEIPLVSDVLNDDPTSELAPDEMSMTYEEPYNNPSVIVSHRLSSEHDLVSPQVEPIIINPMEDGESSDPESAPSLSPVKNASKPGSLEDIPEEELNRTRESEQNEKDRNIEETEKENPEDAETAEEVTEGEEESEEEESESEEEESEEAESEKEVIELFDTEGHEVLGVEEEKPMEPKAKIGRKAGSVDKGKRVSKEDTDLSEVLSLEDVMRRKALESMYKRRAEKEKAKQGGDKKKEEPVRKKNDKDDKRKLRRSRSRSPYRRGRSPDIRGNWRGRRGPSPFGRDGRRSPPPYGRRSPPFGRRSPPRRRSPFHRQDRHDPVHRMAVQRLRGQRNQAERDLEELAAEADKLEKKIRSSAESVKILKQVELKKRKELLRKQLEEVSKELNDEGDDSSSSSSSSSCSSSCSGSDSTSEPNSPWKRGIVSRVQRLHTHKQKLDKNTGARQGVTLEEIRRRRALKTQPLYTVHADSDGSGKKGLSLAEIRRRRALKFGTVKADTVRNENMGRKPVQVAKSSSSGQSSDEGEGSQGSGSSELVILKKVEPLRKMNIRKVVSQGAQNSTESLEAQAQREMNNKNALKKIQVQRIVQDSSADAEPDVSSKGINVLQQARKRLLQKLKDEEESDIEEETGESIEKEKKSVADKPKSSFRRVLVVDKEAHKKETSVKKAATDIVIKSLEDIKRDKERQRDTLKVSEEAETADNHRRRKFGIPRNKSDTNLLKRGAEFSDEESEAKRRLVRRNPRGIYVPPAAAKMRAMVKVDEPATTAVTLPESKFVDDVSPKAEARKIPMSQLKEARSSGGEIIVKTFSEIMKEKRERKQKELELKRATALKSEDSSSRSKAAFISPITFDQDKGKSKASLSENAAPKRKLYSEPEKQESRMLSNWGARRSKPLNKVQPNDSKTLNTQRTNVPKLKSISESVPSKKMEIIDFPPDDDDLDLDEFEMELREEMEQERSKPEPVVTKPVQVSDSVRNVPEKALPPVNSVKVIPKYQEPDVAVSGRKTSTEEKVKPSRRTSTADNLLEDINLLLGEDEDISVQDSEVQVQDDDALLMELEEMLA